MLYVLTDQCMFTVTNKEKKKKEKIEREKNTETKNKTEKTKHAKTNYRTNDIEQWTMRNKE